MGVISDFSDFLEEYKVMSLAIAFIIGTALTAMVQSLVNNVIMPIIGIFLPMGDWQGATVTVGGAVIGWGTFASELISFIILAFVVFFLVKILVGEKKSEKKSVRKKK